jgi:hypothetical protein
MSAPRTIVPPGYNPSLDRLPPRSAGGCSGTVVLAVSGLLVIVVGMLMIVRSMLPSPAPIVSQLPITEIPTETATLITSTPDAWSATGTALYNATITPTVDYCWWLTPTATSTVTPEFTPDAWSATGTAVYYATNPAKEATATPDAPQAWCDHIPTLTPTFTPLSIDGFEKNLTPMPTQTATVAVAAGQTPAVFPTVYVPPDPNQPVEPIVTSSVPYTAPSLTPDLMVLPTQIAPTPTATETFSMQLQTRTFTPMPTATFTSTWTPSQTATETATSTPTLTLTATATWTPTLTVTATDTATLHPMHTATMTSTATETPTATESISDVQ